MRKYRIKNLMVTKIIIIFLIFNILSIFCFTSLVIIREEKKSVEYAQRSLQEIVKEKTELINIKFERIETQMEIIRIWAEKILNSYEFSPEISSQYVYDENGNIIRTKNKDIGLEDQSNILIPKEVRKTPEVMRSINFTEEFDEVFSNILKTENITWAYITTRENLLRCSPYHELQDRFNSNHNQRMDIFYTSADEMHNPDKKIVWTKPYNDYLGTGWTITCSIPIYDQKDELYGVISFDIAIDNIEKEYFEEFSLDENGKCYWINKKGDIFYSSSDDSDTHTPGDEQLKNIFNNKELSSEHRNAIYATFNKERGIETFKENGIKKLLVFSDIKNADSTLIIEMDVEEIMENIHFNFEYAIILVYVELLLVFIFGFILYQSFSKPMKKLVNCAERIESGNYSFVENEFEEKPLYYEIDQLNSAFKSMNLSLKIYSEKVKEKAEEIKKILDTIEGTLVTVDMQGQINLISKSPIAIKKEDILTAIKCVNETKKSFSNQTILDGQVYRNIYYPLDVDSGEIKKILIYSECITDTLLMEKAMQQLEKMAGVGQLSAAIVHELKNILARIGAAVYILRMKQKNGEDEAELEIIMKAVEEAENVITTLLEFSKENSNGKEMIHIKTMVNQIILLSKKEIIRKNILVKINIDDDCYWESVSREALKVILQNIILNAIQAIEYDGKIDISQRIEGGNIVISIKDNGGGLKFPKDKIFEPFFTTKTSGTGIGLWIVKRLIDTIEGRLDVKESVKGETEFIIFLPIE